MLQLELHRMLQADRERDLQDSLRRHALLKASAPDADSDRIVGVPLRDRPSHRGDPVTDLGRCQDLDPAPRG